MQPPNLRFIVNRTILKYLVCGSDVSRDHIVMLEYFGSFDQGIFGNEILSQIIQDYPGELTDELLLVLSPPNLRHLKLTKCSRLSCSGLRQVIARCQQLQALDFSECIHLLHPTVFCCLKDKAVNLVSLSLENSEVVSDDIVQVALICCPQLKHLNLSSCRHITDAAFALSNSELNSVSNKALTTNSTSSKNVSLPGSNLTSVDVSGCQSLSTTAIKYLASICGPNLRSIDLAWTGVSCTALLYLAGLNMEEVARLVHDTDHTLANSTAKGKCCSSDNCAGPQLIPGGSSVTHNQSKKGNDLTLLQKPEQTACSRENGCEVQNELIGILSKSFEGATQNDSIICISETDLLSPKPVDLLAVDCHDCDESLLNEIELLRLKDAIQNTYKSSVFMAPEKHPLKFSETESDEESDDSFKTASDELDLVTFFLPTSEKICCTCEVSMEAEGRFSTDRGILKSAGTKELCCNVSVGSDLTSNLLEVNKCSCKEPHVFTNDNVLSFSQGSSKELKNVTRNSADLNCEQSSEGGDNEEIHVFEDCYDVESYIINSCKEKISKKNDTCFHQSEEEKCSLENNYSNTCFSYDKLSVLTVNENEPVVFMTTCETAEQEEVKCVESDNSTARADLTDLEYLEVHFSNIKDMESGFCITPCTEMNHKYEEEVVEDRVKCKCFGQQQTLQGVESDSPVMLDVSNTDNWSRYPSIPSTPLELGQNSSSSSLLWVDEEKIGSEHTVKPCSKDTGFVLSSVPCENVAGDKLCATHSKMEQSTCTSSDFLPSHSKFLQVSDLLQAQIYQPQITSLDITNICYQNKPLGVVCLKVFSKACNHLKNFAVSWAGLDDKMLTYLLKNEKELETLSLIDCESLSNISVSTIPVHCPNLTSFDLKGMCYVTDHGVMPLTRSNDLEILCLAEAAITDYTLQSIAKGCGAKLKVLDVSWCEDLTDSGMSIIANSCPSLQHLGLRQCAASHLTLEALAANCHLISSLNIAGVDGLTDVALGRMAENMPLLKEIDVSWNSSLSDGSVSALLQCCTKLNKAVLCGLKRITSQPFLAIIGDLGRWCLLEELCRSNRRSLRNVSKGNLALKFCDADTAKSLGDQIPCRSMSYAPSLRQVMLEYSDKVNDDHLSAIVAVCRGTLFIKDYYAQPVEPKWIFR